jgi:septum formation protein
MRILMCLGWGFRFAPSVLLLASASPARRRLLEQAGIQHRVQVSGVDEEAITHPDPAQLVQLLARAKAQTVHNRIAETAGGDAPISAVLGCDSVLAFAGEVFGKPADAAEAIARWQRMAGAWGELHTGHCLVSGPGEPGVIPSERLTTVTTRVRFAPLSDAEIEAYVATGEPLQCAGGFALEGRGGLVVEQLDGCYSNVIGLSLPLLRRWLN